MYLYFHYISIGIYIYIICKLIRRVQRHILEKYNKYYISLAI